MVLPCVRGNENEHFFVQRKTNGNVRPARRAAASTTRRSFQGQTASLLEESMACTKKRTTRGDHRYEQATRLQGSPPLAPPGGRGARASRNAIQRGARRGFVMGVHRCAIRDDSSCETFTPPRRRPCVVDGIDDLVSYRACGGFFGGDGGSLGGGGASAIFLAKGECDSAPNQ